MITNQMIIDTALELEAEGVPMILRRSNPGRQEVCPRNHDLSVHGRFRYKTKPDGTKVKNGRECSECKRMRQRKGWQEGDTA